jgi:hypothetical protein
MGRLELAVERMARRITKQLLFFILAGGALLVLAFSTSATMFVGEKRTMRYHNLDHAECRAQVRPLTKHQKQVYVSRVFARHQGYKPCAVCRM